MERWMPEGSKPSTANRKSMKVLACGFLAAVVAVSIAGCTGESDGDSGSPGTAGLNLSGSWSGEYTAPGARVALRAKIVQTGDAVVISTTKGGVAQLLTGFMGPNGSLYLTDSVDAEIWTSDGDVTESGFLVRDYLFNPELGSDSPEQDLILHR